MSFAATATVPRGSAPNPILAVISGLNLQSRSQAASTVFVVDDDISLRRSLQLIIRAQGWQVQAFESAQEFLTGPRSFSPSCLVLAFSSTELNDLEAQARIARERAEIPIIVISGNRDVPTTVKAMKAGAVDFLVKPFSNEALLGAIRQGLIISRVALDREREKHALRICYDSLTARERQVLTLVVSGLLNKQVGDELGISEITVKFHRGNVMRKMKADSFAELVNMAARLRIKGPFSVKSSGRRTVFRAIAGSLSGFACSDALKERTLSGMSRPSINCSLEPKSKSQPMQSDCAPLS